MKVYTPLGNKVIVDVFPEQENLKGSIYVGQLGRTTGKIEKVGKDVTWVKEGDVVVFEPGAPIFLDAIDNKLAWMEEAQIVYIVTEVPDKENKD